MTMFPRKLTNGMRVDSVGKEDEDDDGEVDGFSRGFVRCLCCSLYLSPLIQALMQKESSFSSALRVPLRTYLPVVKKSGSRWCKVEGGASVATDGRL